MRRTGIMWSVVALFVMCAGLSAADGDVESLRALLADQQRTLSEQNARMAAQDARLNDLQAKMNDSKTPEKAARVTSIRKNAAVTIGGQLNTRYTFHDGNVKSQSYSTTTAGNVTTIDRDAGGNAIPVRSRTKKSDYKSGNLHISEARLKVQIDVNEYFDAFLQLDMQHDANRQANVAGNAQKYWIRWKNLCNTGFGVLMGRNDFIFSDRYNVGEYSGLLGKHDDFGSLWSASGVQMNGWNGGDQGEGMFSHRGNMTPNHVGWDYSRTTQINPYWEVMDGALRFDVSLIQSAERMNGTANIVEGHTRDGVYRQRSINYGLGSGTFRVMWKPIEGLSITGSVANFYQGNAYNGTTNRWDGRRGTSSWAAGHAEWIAKNATATNLSVRWNPAFANSFNFWGKWTHGWNDGWTRDLDSDAVNFGASYSWADRWTYFAQADFFWNKNKRDVVEQWHKGQIWAFYTGLTYKLPYGVTMELAWRHEEAAYKNRAGYKHTKAKMDTIYGHMGFDF